MSYLLISDFVDAGKKAIKNNNYWGALAIALMLPSLCSRDVHIIMGVRQSSHITAKCHHQ